MLVPLSGTSAFLSAWQIQGVLTGIRSRWLFTGLGLTLSRRIAPRMRLGCAVSARSRERIFVYSTSLRGRNVLVHTRFPTGISFYCHGTREYPDAIKSQHRAVISYLVWGLPHWLPLSRLQEPKSIVSGYRRVCYGIQITWECVFRD